MMCNKIILLNILFLIFCFAEENAIDQNGQKDSYEYTIQYSDSNENGNYGHRIEVKNGNAKVNLNPAVLDLQKTNSAPTPKYQTADTEKKTNIVYVPKSNAAGSDNKVYYTNSNRQGPVRNYQPVAQVPLTNQLTFDKNELALLLTQNKNPYLINRNRVQENIQKPAEHQHVQKQQESGHYHSNQLVQVPSPANLKQTKHVYVPQQSVPKQNNQVVYSHSPPATNQQYQLQYAPIEHQSNAKLYVSPQLSSSPQSIPQKHNPESSQMLLYLYVPQQQPERVQPIHQPRTILYNYPSQQPTPGTYQQTHQHQIQYQAPVYTNYPQPQHLAVHSDNNKSHHASAVHSTRLQNVANSNKPQITYQHSSYQPQHLVQIDNKQKQNPQIYTPQHNYIPQEQLSLNYPSSPQVASTVPVNYKNSKEQIQYYIPTNNYPSVGQPATTQYSTDFTNFYNQDSVLQAYTPKQEPQNYLKNDPKVNNQASVTNNAYNFIPQRSYNVQEASSESRPNVQYVIFVPSDRTDDRYKSA